MPLLGTPKESGGSRGLPAVNERFTLACELFRLGLASEAYLLFSEISGEEKYPSLLVNLALCHMKAGEWQNAQSYLEQAMTELKKNLASRKPVNGTFRHLAELELIDHGYLSPMPRHAPEFSPEYAATTVRRLMVDCYAAMQLWEKVRALSAAFTAPRYRNVELALEKAENTRR